MNHSSHGSPAALSIGFILSVILTTASFLLVGRGNLGLNATLVSLAVLAASQLVVQLLFFLHLGKERGVRWNLIAFGFMGLIVAIIVVGTLWIMHNLDYNMMHMSEEESDSYMLEQKDKGF